METQVYNFPSVVKGTTFNTRKITFPFSITGACISMQFCKKEGSPMVFEWKTSDSTLNIISETEMYMVARKLTSASGIYYYDIVVTFPDNTTYVYFKGSLRITQNVSVCTTL